MCAYMKFKSMSENSKEKQVSFIILEIKTKNDNSRNFEPFFMKDILCQFSIHFIHEIQITSNETKKSSLFKRQEG